MLNYYLSGMSNKPKQPSPNGKVFEYTVRKISLSDWDMMNQDEVLNKFGDGGWELCSFSIIRIKETEMFQLIFKRERAK